MNHRTDLVYSMIHCTINSLQSQFDGVNECRAPSFVNQHGIGMPCLHICGNGTFVATASYAVACATGSNFGFFSLTAAGGAGGSTKPSGSKPASRTMRGTISSQPIAMM